MVGQRNNEGKFIDLCWKRGKFRMMEGRKKKLVELFFFPFLYVKVIPSFVCVFAECFWALAPKFHSRGLSRKTQHKACHTSTLETWINWEAYEGHCRSIWRMKSSGISFWKLSFLFPFAWNKHFVFFARSLCCSFFLCFHSFRFFFLSFRSSLVEWVKRVKHIGLKLIGKICVKTSFIWVGNNGMERNEKFVAVGKVLNESEKNCFYRKTLVSIVFSLLSFEDFWVFHSSFRLYLSAIISRFLYFVSYRQTFCWESRSHDLNLGINVKSKPQRHVTMLRLFNSLLPIPMNVLH